MFFFLFSNKRPNIRLPNVLHKTTAALVRFINKILSVMLGF